jgi:hypothetical protein
MTLWPAIISVVAGFGMLIYILVGQKDQIHLEPNSATTYYINKKATTSYLR